MQCGSDMFIRCNFSHDVDNSVYVIASAAGRQCDQLTFDNCLIQTCGGMGMYVEFQVLHRITANALSIRNMYMEGNAGGDYQFVGVRSASIFDSKISSIQLTESSVSLYNCFSDPMGDAYYNIQVDNLSSLVAYEHKYQQTTSEDIFVHSICYDGSSDIHGTSQTLTSVWGTI